jgi:hypothetical protein
MGFAADLNALCARAGDKAELVVRKTALELQSGMIEMSPVDTGRFKGNWQVGIGGVNPAANDEPDKSGASVLGRTQVALATWKPGQSIWLTNSLAYAQRLEDGSSRQAPSGMVKLTVQSYAEALKKAVQEAK